MRRSLVGPAELQKAAVGGGDSRAVVLGFRRGWCCPGDLSGVSGFPEDPAGGDGVRPLSEVG